MMTFFFLGMILVHGLKCNSEHVINVAQEICGNPIILTLIHTLNLHRSSVLYNTWTVLRFSICICTVHILLVTYIIVRIRSHTTIKN